jgi:hypothetical protein
MFPIPTIYPLDELYIYKDAVVDTSKLIVTVETISQEISEIKEKIKSYEADLQTAKQKGDKEEVKLLREGIRTKENLLLSKENILISENNLLIKLQDQEEENLFISNAKTQGFYIQKHFRASLLSLALSHINPLHQHTWSGLGRAFIFNLF